MLKKQQSLHFSSCRSIYFVFYCLASTMCFQFRCPVVQFLSCQVWSYVLQHVLYLPTEEIKIENKLFLIYKSLNLVPKVGLVEFLMGSPFLAVSRAISFLETCDDNFLLQFQSEIDLHFVLSGHTGTRMTLFSLPFPQQTYRLRAGQDKGGSIHEHSKQRGLQKDFHPHGSRRDKFCSIKFLKPFTLGLPHRTSMEKRFKPSAIQCVLGM